MFLQYVCVCLVCCGSFGEACIASLDWLCARASAARLPFVSCFVPASVVCAFSCGLSRFGSRECFTLLLLFSLLCYFLLSIITVTLFAIIIICVGSVYVHFSLLAFLLASSRIY